MTAPVTPIYMERYRTIDNRAKKVGFEIPIPEVCAQYYSVFRTIDQCNRCRKDDLYIDKTFRTQLWLMPENTSNLSMFIVAGWLLYKKSHG